MLNVPYPAGWFEAPNNDNCDCGVLVDDCWALHVTGCKYQGCSIDCQSCKEVIENDLEESAMEQGREDA